MKTSGERGLRIARRMRPNSVLAIAGVLLLGGVLISVMGIAMDKEKALSLGMAMLFIAMLGSIVHRELNSILQRIDMLEIQQRDEDARK